MILFYDILLTSVDPWWISPRLFNKINGAIFQWYFWQPRFCEIIYLAGSRQGEEYNTSSSSDTTHVFSFYFFKTYQEWILLT